MDSSRSAGSSLTADAGRADELAALRRRMAAMSGRPDQQSVEVRDPAEGVLPVPGPLAEILPHAGIPRGTVVCHEGANSLLVAMIASVTRGGGQVGIVGLPRLSLLAAVEMGADLSRLATVPDPGADPVEVATVLLDGMDLVVLGAVESVAPARTRVVMGRVRKQSSVLMVTGGGWPGARTTLEARVLTYRHSPAVTMTAEPVQARSGYGRIGGMRLRVTAFGRGSQSRSTEVDLVADGYCSERRVQMIPVAQARPVLAVAN